MSFDWDAYQGGGSYITAAEKKVMAENGIPFTVQAIRQVHKFDNENYELTILAPNPESGEDEERILSFPIGSGAESRDNMLHGMKKYLDEGGDPLTAKVTKIGRAFFLAQA